MKRMLPTMTSRMPMPMRMKRMVVLDGPPSEPDVLFSSALRVAVGEADRVGVTVGEAVTDGEGDGDGDGEGDGDGVTIVVETVRALAAVAFIVVSFCATAITE